MQMSRLHPVTAWLNPAAAQQHSRKETTSLVRPINWLLPATTPMGLHALALLAVLYRNPLPEIARFLQTYHRGRAKVYNLCSEYTYSAEKLSVALQHYPFDDHQVCVNSAVCAA